MKNKITDVMSFFSEICLEIYIQRNIKTFVWGMQFDHGIFLICDFLLHRVHVFFWISIRCQFCIVLNLFFTPSFTQTPLQYSFTHVYLVNTFQIDSSTEIKVH